MRQRNRAWALLLSAVLAQPILATAVAPGAEAATCRPYTVIGVRGTGETGGMGRFPSLSFQKFVSIKGLNTVTPDSVDYPASLNYAESMRQGRDGLVNKIRQHRNNCPSTQFVLFGYSQGAHVVGDVVRSRLTEQERQAIYGVGLLGDPMFNPGLRGSETADRSLGGMFGRRDYWPSGVYVIDVCNDGDYVCSSDNAGAGLDYLKHRYNEAHWSYDKTSDSPVPTAPTDFIATRVATRSYSWYRVGTGRLRQTDLGPQGELWGVNGAGTIFQYAGSGNWTSRGSSFSGSAFKYVTVGAVSSGPHVYATLADDRIVRWDGSRWSQVGTGRLKQIELGPQGSLWGVNAAGNVFQYAGSGKWTARGSGFRHVTVGRNPLGGPYIYATKGDDSIVRWTGTGWQSLPGTGRLRQVDMSAQGQLWGVNASGNVYRYEGNGAWRMHGSGFRHVSAGTSKGPWVYATKSDDTIVRFG